MDSDHVMTARAIGLRPLAVRRRHIVPSARLPIVTQIALNFGFVLGGAITVEALFSWPGVGLATIQAIQNKDFPMLQGIFLVTSAHGDHREPRRRSALLAPRPQGAHRMSVVSHDPAEVARRIRGERQARGRRLARDRPRDRALAPRAGRLHAARSCSRSWRSSATCSPPQDPNAASSFSTSAAQNLQSPSSAHWLGTDESGRDVLSEILYAAPITLTVGLAAAIISTLIGTFVGVIAGYFGGWTDRLLMALDDWVLVLPSSRRRS